jgi:hypothetical protein
MGGCSREAGSGALDIAGAVKGGAGIRRARFRQRRDRDDEAIALPVNGLNGRGITQAPVHDFTQLGEAAGEGGFGDKGIRPALREEFVFGHHAVAMLEQIEQHLKHLGFNRHELALMSHLAAGHIQLVSPKGIDHSRFSHTIPHGSYCHCRLHRVKRLLAMALYKQSCHAINNIMRHGKGTEVLSRPSDNGPGTEWALTLTF